MKIGFVGLGKLGLPVATCLALRGHEVVGYDSNPERMTGGPMPEREKGISVRMDGGDFNAHLARAVEAKTLRFGNMADVVRCDVVFVAVETPHDERFGGERPLGFERADFDYEALVRACNEINVAAMASHAPYPVISVISTMLPGTMRREIEPALAPLPVVYNPSFIAMGTVMRDFLEPEFVLIGRRAGVDADRVGLVYRDADIAKPRSAPIIDMNVESAELTKVAYNTYISAKIGIANTLMEICDRVPGADIDEVSNALQRAHIRVASPEYMRGGMGDGGGCHPRDNIAMSWLANRLCLSHNVFDDAMRARDEHAHTLALQLLRLHQKTGLPICIRGYAYKPNVGLTAGSSALLVRNYINKPVHLADPHAGGEDPSEPHVFLVGCAHDDVPGLNWPAGSIVIDPFRIVPDRDGVEVIRLGEASRGE